MTNMSILGTAGNNTYNLSRLLDPNALANPEKVIFVISDEFLRGLLALIVIVVLGLIFYLSVRQTTSKDIDALTGAGVFCTVLGLFAFLIEIDGEKLLLFVRKGEG